MGPESTSLLYERKYLKVTLDEGGPDERVGLAKVIIK